MYSTTAGQGRGQCLYLLLLILVVSRFRHNNDLKLETNQKAQLASQAAAQWLSLRLQLIGVGMVAGVSVLGAMQHHLSIADPGVHPSTLDHLENSYLM